MRVGSPLAFFSFFSPSTDPLSLLLSPLPHSLFVVPARSHFSFSPTHPPFPASYPTRTQRPSLVFPSPFRRPSFFPHPPFLCPFFLFFSFSALWFGFVAFFPSVFTKRWHPPASPHTSPFLLFLAAAFCRSVQSPPFVIPFSSCIVLLSTCCPVLSGWARGAVLPLYLFSLSLFSFLFASCSSLVARPPARTALCLLGRSLPSWSFHHSSLRLSLLVALLALFACSFLSVLHQFCSSTSSYS